MINKKITILATVSMSAIAITAIIAVGYIVNLKQEENNRQVEKFALDYAQKDCEKKGLKGVCGKLQAYVASPGDWGSREYIVYVEASEKRLFNSAVVVRVDISGNVELVDYSEPYSS